MFLGVQYTGFRIMKPEVSRRYDCVEGSRCIFRRNLNLTLEETKIGWLGWEDTESVGVTHTTLPALDNNDGLASGEDTKAKSLRDTPLDAAVDILLPVGLGEVWLLLLEVEWVDTAVKMAKSGGRSVAGNHEDWANWAVLGDEAGRLSGGGKNNDGTSVHVKRSTDGGHGAGLNNGDWALGEVAKLLEVGDVGNGVLSLEAGLVHLSNGLVRVATLGSLTRPT